MRPAELLAKYGIRLPSTKPGRYYATCPQCSAKRSRAGQKKECLGVTIDANGAHWGCNHCGWTGPEKGSGNGKVGASPFEATYDYIEDGEFRFQKVRYPKGHEPPFALRTRNGSRWKWGAQGIHKPLYRIDEVVEAIANRHTILVVEGEKDADSCWRIGLPATCNFDGAAKPGQKPKWRAEYSEKLRGADIVVLNDNDPPGYAHADTIARMLLGIAARVRRLDLAPHWPGIPKGGDVSDWLAAGHTREDLDALIERSPNYTDPMQTTDATHDDVPELMIVSGPDSNLPELLIDSSDPTATAKTLAALIAKRDDFLFNGHAPIRVAAEADCLPRALEITTEMVRVLAHELCRPTKARIVKDAVERIAVPLSKDIAQIYLHGLEGRWDLKPFRGITTAPILSDDGAIRSASGYDSRTGLWCFNIPEVAVSAKPTKSDAERALRKLRRFFRTFPFADAVRLYDRDLGVEIVDQTKPLGLDESSFIAALLTAVCRQSLELAPGFLCDAPNYSGAGTGKGLLVKTSSPNAPTCSRPR